MPFAPEIYIIIHLGRINTLIQPDNLRLIYRLAKANAQVEYCNLYLLHWLCFVFIISGGLFDEKELDSSIHPQRFSLCFRFYRVHP